jgi:hypothetical protein
MYKTVWKYQVPVQDYFELELPVGAIPLTVQVQGDTPRMWVLVNPDETKKCKYQFRVLGTGHKSDDTLNYLGTFQVNNGQYVFHVFEIL